MTRVRFKLNTIIRIHNQYHRPEVVNRLMKLLDRHLFLPPQVATYLASNASVEIVTTFNKQIRNAFISVVHHEKAPSERSMRTVVIEGLKPSTEHKGNMLASNLCLDHLEVYVDGITARIMLPSVTA